jgi:8-oxo-dGTP pyrophosphatase MutT (NUDIX family)
LRPVEQAGGIVFRGNDRDISILLVTSKKEDGHWIFPKGHIEPGESADVAALRETSEEAGIEGELVGEVGEPLEFTWGGKRYRVRYFLIRARSETPHTDGRTKEWLSFEEALARLTYDDTRQLLRDARPVMERREAHDA